MTLEGEAHHAERRRLQPAFHRDRLAEAAAVAQRLTRNFIGRWRDGEAVDAYPQMAELTLSVITAALFGERFVNQATSLLRDFDRFQGFNPWMVPYEQLLRALPLPGRRRARQRMRRVAEFASKLIADCRREGPSSRFMALLLEGGEESELAFRDKRARDEVISFLIAGHLTVAVLMTWCLVLLASHPDWQDALHEEVGQVVEGNALSAEDVRRLPTFERVIAETLRLFPSSWMIGRSAVIACEIGGVSIPVGSLVYVSSYAVQRDERWYPDPERFDPLRFSPENVASRPQYSFFPFGAGPRRCIGEQFGLMEATLVLATIMREWRVEAERPIAREFRPGVVLRPRSSVQLVVRRRARSS